ncbi:MAG TPA: TRAP transporter substrate-binding protein DctP, partial [Polyangia bacterium]|nr:TRAP transporter substrate-binding protein DctP [Polyangia bacterium]
MRPAFALVALTVASFVSLPSARGEPVTLRVATIAPEGTAWAREFHAWARDVDAGTGGAVRIKLYNGSIAGDEFTVLDRIKRDQLDGAISSESCVRLGPSLRVTRIFGLFQSRDEAVYVLGRLETRVDAEFLRAGFIHLGDVTIGPEVLFTREPVRSLDELRRTRLWIWDDDPALRLQAPALGLVVVPKPIAAAAAAYDDKSVDGFISMPSAALAFQWSAQAHYLADLAVSYRNGCAFFASRAFDALPLDAQRYVRTAAAELRARLDDLVRRQDNALIGGLFAHQGIKTVPVSERFRMDFYREAHEMRERLGARIAPPRLL